MSESDTRTVAPFTPVVLPLIALLFTLICDPPSARTPVPLLEKSERLTVTLLPVPAATPNPLLNERTPSRVALLVVAPATEMPAPVLSETTVSLTNNLPPALVRASRIPCWVNSETTQSSIDTDPACNILTPA